MQETNPPIGQSSNHTPISSESAPFSTLYYDLLLTIFKTLSLKDIPSVRLTCRHWKSVASDSSAPYGQYMKEINSIENLPLLPAQFSAWKVMPKHWGLITKKNVLKFSSTSEDILTFHPPFFNQSSMFFSFSSTVPFGDRFIYLGQYNYTYFLTPQGKTNINLDLPSDLQPLVSHSLVVINMKNPNEKREFSLLENLPKSVDLSRYQIKSCFPISENKVAILTEGGEISFWDLSDITPKCYKKLQMTSPRLEVYRIGNHLVFSNKVVDLDDPSSIDHEFEFNNGNVKTFENSLCDYNQDKQEIRYFSINDQEKLEKKWDMAVNLLSENLDLNNGQILSFHVTDVNKKFILLTCWQNLAVNLLLLTTQGQLLYTITEKIPEISSIHFSYDYPLFAHLSDNILIYKNPQENNTISFWHFPTKKCIQKFDWTKSIYDIPLWFDDCMIQDIRLSNGMLILLLSTEHFSAGCNKPGKFRIIQFDLQHIPEKGIYASLKSIVSTVKAIYYAFPGKKAF